ncbi:zinc transport system substrate-binding protein [Vibrio diazotrophicus]|uniref:High-affinity zinc uptake system protein ZnuA n=1 Tax=Vibrio diazotrophicus TaxID=685 RepID=A0A329E901_VIBDI|nr:zinc ABC transporter substrate-binding protein ZnuA [Vibrio diazotrophicus]RAS63502.1 zinc transport system substrate-binding protein [Vibrio diazotrophicus]
MFSRITLLLSLIVLPFSSGANTILTSIKPIQMITHELTLGVTEPEVLLSANASPHDYALRPSDVKTIRNSSLVIWFGKDLEPFLEKVLSQQDNVLTLSEIPNLKLRSYGEEGHDHQHDGHNHGTHDPHFWLGVEQVEQVAKAITQKLIDMDSEHKDIYAKNLNEFVASLHMTDEQIAAKLESVKQQPYYVFHDAYDYFEHHYGLNNIGHFTVSPDRKPGAKTLIGIRKALAANGAKCVFSEPQFQPAVIESVVRGSDANTGVLDPLGMDIPVKQGSYFTFLHSMSDSFYSCLAK